MSTQRAKSVPVPLVLTEFEIKIAIEALMYIRSKSKIQAQVRSRVAERIAKKTCAVLDHAMVDDSVAGPDSGTMAGHCTRCGWGFSTILY